MTNTVLQNLLNIEYLGIVDAAQCVVRIRWVARPGVTFISIEFFFEFRRMRIDGWEITSADVQSQACKVICLVEESILKVLRESCTPLAQYWNVSRKHILSVPEPDYQSPHVLRDLVL